MFGQFLTLREISILNSDLPIGVRYVPFGGDDGDIFQVRMVPSSVINLASLVNSDPNTPGKEVTVIIIVIGVIIKIIITIAIGVIIPFFIIIIHRSMGTTWQLIQRMVPGFTWGPMMGL